MISRIIGAVAGWREISAGGDGRVALANLIEKSGVRLISSRFAGERFKVALPDRDARRVFARCEALGIEASLSPLRGLAGLLYRYRRRYGFFLGAAMMIAVTLLSSRFIWDVTVTGNENVPEERIIAGLAELGVRPGAYIPDIDFELVANDYLLASDDIAWISVNMRASLAVVEVLERKKPYEVPLADRPKEGAANLVASEDGEIVLSQVTAGKCLVTPGDVVRKGELLATGEIVLRDESVVYEHAAGRVLAKVLRKIEASVPLEGTRKVYTGESTDRKSVKIFGKTKNLFVNGGNIYKEYDTIISEKKLFVFDRVSLPVTVRTQTDREYVTETYLRTKDEAKALAEGQCRRQLDKLLEDAELASVERRDSFDGKTYTVAELIYIIKDVAEGSEIKEEDKKTNDTENDNY